MSQEALIHHLLEPVEEAVARVIHDGDGPASDLGLRGDRDARRARGREVAGTSCRSWGPTPASSWAPAVDSSMTTGMTGIMSVIAVSISAWTHADSGASIVSTTKTNPCLRIAPSIAVWAGSPGVSIPSPSRSVSSSCQTVYPRFLAAIRDRRGTRGAPGQLVGDEHLRLVAGKAEAEQVQQ